MVSGTTQIYSNRVIMTDLRRLVICFSLNLASESEHRNRVDLINATRQELLPKGSVCPRRAFSRVRSKTGLTTSQQFDSKGARSPTSIIAFFAISAGR